MDILWLCAAIAELTNQITGKYQQLSRDSDQSITTTSGEGVRFSLAKVCSWRKLCAIISEETKAAITTINMSKKDKDWTFVNDDGSVQVWY